MIIDRMCFYRTRTMILLRMIKMNYVAMFKKWVRENIEPASRKSVEIAWKNFLKEQGIIPKSKKYEQAPISQEEYEKI